MTELRDRRVRRRPHRRSHDMLDSALRPSKDRIVDPLAQFLAPRMQPLVLTALSLIAGVAAGVVAAHGSVFWSLPQIGHFGRGALPR